MEELCSLWKKHIGAYYELFVLKFRVNHTKRIMLNLKSCEEQITKLS